MSTGTESSPFVKDPNAVLDYTWDWADWLSGIGDTILTATVTTDDIALTLVSAAQVSSGTKVIAFLSGGVAGKTYRATCHVFTSASPIARQDDRTIYITCAER